MYVFIVMTAFSSEVIRLLLLRRGQMVCECRCVQQRRWSLRKRRDWRPTLHLPVRLWVSDTV